MEQGQLITSRLLTVWIAVGLGALNSAWAGDDAELRIAGDLCLEQLDDAAARIGRHETGMEGTLLELIAECPDLPQLHHNLAVLQARDGDWEAAKEQLEHAIALDSRAASSMQALRNIHRWQAAVAYAKALGGENSQPVPALSAQISLDVNSDTKRRQERDPDLYDKTAVDYELWEWWRTADASSGEHHTHYVENAIDNAQLQELATEGLPDWSEVQREIRFIERDAVATVSWTSTETATLSNLVLLMRVDADRWRIFDELLLP